MKFKRLGKVGLFKMQKIQYVLMGLGIIGVLWFFLPVMTGMINIGNITGMLISGLLFLYGMFFGKINLWLVTLWSKGGGKIGILLAGLLMAAIVVVAAAETTCMVKAATNQPPKGTTALLLGCKVNGTTPSRILRERLEAAYDYLNKNPEAICILSGGKGNDEDISEAQCMYEYLTGKGIDKERLIMEDKSTSTEENVKFSKEILKEKDLGLEVAIITSEFHEYRANVIAEKEGFETYSVSSHTSWMYLPTYYIRELYAIIEQWVFKA